MLPLSACPSDLGNASKVGNPAPLPVNRGSTPDRGNLTAQAGVWINVGSQPGVDDRHSRATVSPGRRELSPAGLRLEQRSRLGVGMPLDAETEELVRAHLGDHEAVRAVVFG